VVAHLATALDVFGLGPDDVYWCTADPGWVTGTSYGIVAPLTAGATMIVDEAEFEAQRWYGLLEQHRVTVWYTAPTAVRMLMRAGLELPARHDLAALRVVASVGEPLSAEAVDWGRSAFGMPIRDTWWQTETGAMMIANTYASDVRPGSMGRPVGGVTIALLDCDDAGELVMRDGRAVELDDPDRIGMIAIRPGWPSMFRDYLGAPQRYASTFVDGWYLSGDLARRDAEGWYWFVGRADDVIKTAGHLIGPFEVESVLNEHPDVVGAGVYGMPDPVAGNVVHAEIVLRDGLEGDDEVMTSVMAHARRRLGAAVAPRSIIAVDSLPYTRSGKVMRRLLRARALGEPLGDTSTLEGSS
jgi:acetyl-CoA synthetase